MRSEALNQLQTLKSDPLLLRSFHQQSLVLKGIELLEKDECPLCDNPRDMRELLAHFEDKLTKAKAASELVSKLESTLRPLAGNLAALASSTAALIKLCGMIDPRIEPEPFEAFQLLCTQRQNIFDKVSEEPSLIDAAIEALSTDTLSPPPTAQEAFEKITKFVEALPEPSKEEAAREFLTIAQERYDRCTETRKARDTALSQSTTASKISGAYAEVSTEELEKIYDEVEKGNCSPPA